MRVALAHPRSGAATRLRRLLSRLSGVGMTWSVEDADSLRAAMQRDRPDILLLEVNLPGPGPVVLVEEAVRQAGCVVVLLTGPDGGRPSVVFAAMGAGALDVVRWPAADPAEEDAFLDSMRRVARLLGEPAGTASSAPAVARPPIETAPPLVAIGASTGGPRAVAELLAGLPRHLPAAVVVVQHIESEFAQGLAEWLAGQSRRPVSLAHAGAVPVAGDVVLSAGGCHLVLDAQQRFRYTDDPRESPCRPSVDIFWLSLARNWPRSGVAVLLTGMGRDGAEGMLALRHHGWLTLAQDQASSVVYGMPRAAVERGAAAQVVALADIPAWIVRQVDAQGSRL